MSHTHATEGHTFASHALPPEADTDSDDAVVLEMDPPADLLPARTSGPDMVILRGLKQLVDAGHHGEAWSRNRVAKALGISPATVSIYLRQDESNAPLLKANLTKLEGQVADFLASLKAKRQFNGSLFETNTSRKMAAWISMVRATNTVGLYLGEAGVGKSCGLELYARENPTALTIAAKPWRRTRDAVVRMLWDQFDTRGWDRRSPRADWIAAHLSGMETVLLVDDSHTLTFAALEFLIYLSEDTGTPLVLVGNPRVVDKLRPEPQLYSRAFLRQTAKLEPGAALNEAAEAVLTREVPEHADTLRGMARQVAAQPGHLRGLTQRCRATRELLAVPEYAGRPAAAFEAAHALSVHSGEALRPD